MKKLFLCAAALLFAYLGQAQQSKYLEAGFLFGLTNYSGDVSEKSIEIRATKPGFGAYLRYHLSTHFSVKGHVYAGSIAGDDKYSTRYKERAFKFSTSLIELGAVGEWNILAHNRFTKTGMHRFFVTPYIFAGLGATFASAQANYYTAPDKFNDYIKDPNEFGVTRNNKFVLVPMGVGLRGDISDRLVIGLEGGWRPVFSDKLDGIENNGNPKSGDWYYFVGTTISFILTNPNRR